MFNPVNRDKKNAKTEITYSKCQWLHECLIPPHETEHYTSSFFPSTTILWHNLPENISCSRPTSVSELRRYFQRNDHLLPAHFYIGTRHPQIIHAKLSLHISDLKQDLVERHLSSDSFCNCGVTPETVEHYLLHCPFYIKGRDITTQTLLSVTLRYRSY